MPCGRTPAPGTENRGLLAGLPSPLPPPAAPPTLRRGAFRLGFPARGTNPRCGGSLLAAGALTRPGIQVLGCLGGRSREGLQRRSGAGLPFLGNLECDPVLLGILGNSPRRLQLADDLLELLTVRRSSQGSGARAFDCATDYLFGGQLGTRRAGGSGPGPRSPASSPPGAARPSGLRIRRRPARAGSTPGGVGSLLRCGALTAPTASAPWLAHRPPLQRPGT